jgi:hypothetical protein
MEKSKVFVDFHNADVQGRLRLNCTGTIEDLAHQKIWLQNGQEITLYSEDLEVDGIVQSIFPYSIYSACNFEQLALVQVLAN